MHMHMHRFSAGLAAYRSSKDTLPVLGAMEMPGQYGGGAEPHPPSHALVDSFGAEVLVMESLRKP